MDSANSETDPLLAAVIRPTPERRTMFLDGPAGAGKTTLAVRRLLGLLRQGVPAESILVWTPQRTLGRPYLDALAQDSPAGGQVTVATVGGLARRTISLYWPLIAGKAGFAHPERPPIFLTLETAQYYMDLIAAPYIEGGVFEGLSIRRSRLVSQIIDNLNKAAVVGFPYTEIAERLKGAWQGESARHRLYDQAQACANGFRNHCLAHNLLDFSLQLDVFFQHVLAEPLCRAALFEGYRHLIVDNVEEDTPRAHDLLRQWLPVCETALIVMDREAGYRAFLGADPESAAELKWLCHDWLTLDPSHVMSPQIQDLGERWVSALGQEVGQTLLQGEPRHERPDRFKANLSGPGDGTSPLEVLRFEPVRFQPQMCEWVAGQVAAEIEAGEPPSEIVILAPFLGDALRFVLMGALARHGVPVRSHRPSRALRDEPAARCLLTLAAIGHPHWGHCPAPEDVAHALMTAIDGMDLIRARLLTEIVYRPHDGRPALTPFEQIRPDVQQRISFVLGQRFDELRKWLDPDLTDTGSSAGQTFQVPLDDWIALLFNDVLARPGFGFYQNLDAGHVASDLIESIYKFRRTVDVERGPFSDRKRVPTADPGEGTDAGAEEQPTPADLLGMEYVRMVEQGVIAATYIESWQLDAPDAVLLAPAYTFLMANRPVDVQFWLNVGSGGWWERLYQPLTHPYVLSRHWPAGKVWDDDDEFAARQLALGKLILGLTRRCRKRIYLGVADLGEQGYEERGPLLQALQRLLRRLRTP